MERLTMREILFRGKRLNNGEWVFGQYVNQYSHTIYLPSVDNDGFDNYHVDPETVGQFTGLTDKNGKKIFDGDIIKTEEYDREVIFMVVYSSAAFMLHNRRKWRYMIGGGEYEVIGNIHDNPELLQSVEEARK